METSLLYSRLPNPQLLNHAIEKLSYNFHKHAASLVVDWGHCGDMGETIRFFEQFDPEVKFIQTWSGSNIDTVYWKDGEGTWKAGRKGRTGQVNPPARYRLKNCK